MEAIKILLVEDEPKVASFIKQGLVEQGFDVDLVFDGEMGERLALRNNYDIMIFDVIVPHINGIELCKKVRLSKPAVPILMLTALGTTEDKLIGFDAGADDYLVKPFEFKELIARVKALTKRGSGVIAATNTFVVSDLTLDLNKKIAVRAGTHIELTAKEFSLLEYFMKNKGRVVSRSEIAESVWEITFDTGTNVVDVYVNILRKKIDRDFPNKLIHTRIGMGYIFNEQE